MPQTAMEFELNGRAVTLDLPPDTPLLYALRNDLDCKGVRFGCGQGLCGACKVLMDGTPINACDTPLWSVAGHKIRTIESAVHDPRLSGLVDALVAGQAGQCGYCLPGIAMKALALLETEDRPDRATIAHALEGNLCRCGAHNRILAAIEAAGARGIVGEVADHG